MLRNLVVGETIPGETISNGNQIRRDGESAARRKLSSYERTRICGTLKLAQICEMSHCLPPWWQPRLPVGLPVAPPWVGSSIPNHHCEYPNHCPKFMQTLPKHVQHKKTSIVRENQPLQLENLLKQTGPKALTGGSKILKRKVSGNLVRNRLSSLNKHAPKALTGGSKILKRKANASLLFTTCMNYIYIFVI